MGTYLMNERRTLQITSEFAELQRVRKFLHDFCDANAGADFTENHMAEIELAVNEATANIMEHAYEGEEGKSIRVNIQSMPGQLTIELIHEGRAFTPDSVPPPSFDGSRSNGFGVFLIANCMDDVQYTENRDDSKSIIMVKNY